MDWIQFESFRLGSPLFADKFVWCEALEGLEAATEIVGCDEVDKVCAQLVMVIVMEAFDGRFLDGAVHPLDLTIGPGMLDLGQPMLDVVFVADPVEDVVERITIAGAVGELDAIVRQHGMDGVRDGFDQIAQELGGRHLACLLMQFDKSELGRSVNRDKEIQLAFGGLHLGDIDVKITNRVGFEFLLDRLVALDIWQSGYAVALQAPVQRRTGKVGNGWLERIEAVVQRQQRMLSEGHDDRLFSK